MDRGFEAGNRLTFSSLSIKGDDLDDVFPSLQAAHLHLPAQTVGAITLAHHIERRLAAANDHGPRIHRIRQTRENDR